MRFLKWQKRMLPHQGYKGVRWPKMIGPDGMEAPSGVGPLLVWQQPHPIFYAELLYRENPTQETLNRFGDLIKATAEFMFDYASLGCLPEMLCSGTSDHLRP